MKKIVLSVLLVLIFISCTSQAEKFEAALYAGNLTEAETILKDIEADYGRHVYAQMLIEEYLSIDELDKAIHVYAMPTFASAKNWLPIGRQRDIFSSKALSSTTTKCHARTLFPVGDIRAARRIVCKSSAFTSWSVNFLILRRFCTKSLKFPITLYLRYMIFV